MANYTLDIKKPSRQFIIEGLHQGDNGFRDFHFHFTDGARAFPLPESCIVTLFSALPDGTTVYDTCALRDDGSVLYTLKGGTDNSSITSCAGVCDCELRVTSSGGKVLTSPRFAFLIEDTLQTDPAIESRDSFSALTDALGRVLEAESGLSSKADKVIGTVGNTVVIGQNGSICDSGISPVALYKFHYDEDGSYNQYNRELGEHLISDCQQENAFVVNLIHNGVILPATAEISATGTLNISALDKNGIRYLTIEITASAISYETKNTLSSSFNDKENTAATQKATADWVKAYVDEAITEGEW